LRTSYRILGIASNRLKEQILLQQANIYTYSEALVDF
jgi:hypothetical protein